MVTTPKLGLPLIDASQAQKHVTHNVALAALDQIVQLGILSRTLATPPAAPAEGDAYLPAPAATGSWSGKSGQVAVWSGGQWTF